ncbi:hypothetical protein WKH57_01250 [Niallia taxi]
MNNRSTLLKFMTTKNIPTRKPDGVIIATMLNLLVQLRILYLFVSVGNVE